MTALFRPSPSMNTRLLEAAWMGRIEEIERTLHYGANVNVRDRHASSRGQTPLHRLLSNAGTEVEDVLAALALLLPAGANPNLIDGTGQTPAMVLFERGTSHMIRQVLPPLLAHGLRLDGAPSAQPTPVFQCSSRLFRPDLLDLVLAHGGSLAQRNPLGDTPLLDHLRTLHLGARPFTWGLELLDRGADVNAISTLDQASSLTLTALALEHVDTALDHLQALLTRGADPSHAQTLMVPGSTGGRMSHALPDKAYHAHPVAQGYTALHFAAWHGALDGCALLLGHGANPLARTSARALPARQGGYDRFVEDGPGFTPRDLALRAGHDHVASLLEGAELRVEMRAEPMVAAPSRPRSRL